MRLCAYLELVRLVEEAPTKGLEFVSRAIRTGSDRLIRGDGWGDGDRGCLATHFGRFHPGCRANGEFGFNFLALCGLADADDEYDDDLGTIYGSSFLHDFDTHAVKDEEIARVIRAEIRARRRAASPKPMEVSR